MTDTDVLTIYWIGYTASFIFGNLWFAKEFKEITLDTVFLFIIISFGAWLSLIAQIFIVLLHFIFDMDIVIWRKK